MLLAIFKWQPKGYKTINVKKGNSMQIYSTALCEPDGQSLVENFVDFLGKITMFR